jgi:rfaE bifunctional protein kinase chain/domain
MIIDNKIIKNINNLKEYVDEVKNQNKTIAICQGHFNVIHPGHLRFLEFVKKHADCVIVIIHGESKISPDVRDRFYKDKERAHGVASLGFIDRVFIVDELTIEYLLEIIKPTAYVLGEEFSKRINEIKNQIDIVEKNNGKIIFSSGDINYTSVELLDKNIIDLKRERLLHFREALKKQNISILRLIEYIKKFNKANILVIGDTIIDQYVACDALGMSSEAPVLVVKELENKEYIGGAAIVARHVKALGANCSFISLVGDDSPAKFVEKELVKEKINSKFIIDTERPTIYKIRYMVGTQKILRVSRLKDHHINQREEEEIISYINNIADKLDGIIISDFGYGLISPNIIRNLTGISKKNNIKLFGDSQSSSQIGNIEKFKDFYLLTPTEKEARIALNDKYNGLEYIGNNLLRLTNSKNIILKLNSKGFIAFESTENKYFVKTQFFPALNPCPVDVVGAGDSLLTGLAASICIGANLMEASAIGVVVASLAVSKMGNVAINNSEVLKCLKELN